MYSEYVLIAVTFTASHSFSPTGPAPVGPEPLIPEIRYQRARVCFLGNAPISIEMPRLFCVHGCCLLKGEAFGNGFWALWVAALDRLESARNETLRLVAWNYIIKRSGIEYEQVSNAPWMQESF